MELFNFKNASTRCCDVFVQFVVLDNKNLVRSGTMSGVVPIDVI
jgi:hypothetical protein